MNRLSDIYYTTESYLFPMVEEEIGEITGKMKEFLRKLEVVRPSRFLTNACLGPLNRPASSWLLGQRSCQIAFLCSLFF